MAAQNLQDKLTEMLAKGNFKSSFELLKQNLESKNKLKGLASLERRYYSIKTEIRNGTISSNEADLKTNRIHQSLIDLVNSPEEASSNDFSNSKTFLSSRNIIFLALLFVILVFILGKTNVLNFGSGDPTTIIGDNNQVGDLTTSAENRYKNAVALIQEEAMSNFSAISLLIRSLEENQQVAFSSIDKQRPNESGAAFQDRAIAFHKEYRDFVREKVEAFSPVTEVYSSFKINLEHKPNIASLYKKSYDKKGEVKERLVTLSQKMSNVINSKKTDLEISEKLVYLQREQTLYAKIAFAEAADYYLQTPPDEVYLKLLKQHLSQAGIPLKKHTAKELHQELLLEIAKLYQQKADIIEETIKKPLNNGQKKEIQRLISDPYLINLRKMAGLSNELTESEAWALKNKKVIDTISDPQELLSQAVFAYLESDASTTGIYLKKALQAPSLNPKMRQFMKLSLARVQKPDIYEGSLGMMVVEVLPGGAFEEAGILEGDIIYKLNGILVNEPLEISMEMGKTASGDDALFELKRDGKTIKKAIKGDKGIGAKLTQLIILNIVQI